MIEEHLMTVEVVAKRLAIGVPTVRGWLREGKLSGVKLPGGDWRIHESDLSELLRRSTHGR